MWKYWKKFILRYICYTTFELFHFLKDLLESICWRGEIFTTARPSIVPQTRPGNICSSSGIDAIVQTADTTSYVFLMVLNQTCKNTVESNMTTICYTKCKDSSLILNFLNAKTTTHVDSAFLSKSLMANQQTQPNKKMPRSSWMCCLTV